MQMYIALETVPEIIVNTNVFTVTKLIPSIGSTKIVYLTDTGAFLLAAQGKVRL